MPDCSVECSVDPGKDIFLSAVIEVGVCEGKYDLFQSNFIWGHTIVYCATFSC